MDIQIFLVIILAILTLSLVIVCGYVIVILREFKVTIHKFNDILDSAQNIRNSLLSTSGVFGLVSTIVESVKAIKSIRTIADYDKKEE